MSAQAPESAQNQKLPRLTYDSLRALRNDLRDNVLKQGRILTAGPSRPIIVITRASVTKVFRWPGGGDVVVEAYEKIDEAILYGIVFIDPDALKDVVTYDFIENLKNNDVVTIVGTASYFQSSEGIMPIESIQFFGCVYPVVRQ